MIFEINRYMEKGIKMNGIAPQGLLIINPLLYSDINNVCSLTKNKLKALENTELSY